jgi:hypothetical protein
VNAAQDAARVFAWDRAAAQYERAVAVLEAQPDHDDETLCDVLLALGDARTRALERQHALPVFLRAADVAERLGSNDRLALAAIGYGYMAKAAMVDDHALALWDRALARTDDPALQSMLRAARATHMTFAGQDEAARAETRAALDQARATRDVRALALALAGRSIALWGTPEATERQYLARELAALGILASNDEWLLDGMELLGAPLLELGDVDEFDRLVTELRRAGERTGRASSIAQSTQWAAMRALMRGDLDEARVLADQVMAVAENAPNFAMGHAAQRYVIERDLGTHDAMLPLVAAFAAEHPDVVAWQAVHTRALAEAGHTADATRALAAVVERLADAPHNWTWVAALVVSAETVARVGATDAATVVEDLLAPWAGRLAVVASGATCEGAVDRYLGLLAATRGDDAGAAERFEAALALEDRVGAAALARRTRLDYATVLRRAGGRARAARAAHLEREAAAQAPGGGLGNFRPAT